jgi:hypothetical protein
LSLLAWGLPPIRTPHQPSTHVFIVALQGLIMNFLHAFYPSLLKIPGFLLEFITPIVKVCCD